MTRSNQLPTMQTGVPIVHISEAPSRANKLHKMEHRRWNSEPEKRRMVAKPFAYEYKFEDGCLTGLAEYHPEDYMHYSSSRNTSTTVSRNQSTRTSSDDTMVKRSSSSSQTSNTSQGPPPSPGRIDGLKRALTLHTLKRRASSEVKKTPPPSPYSRPEISRLAASFGPKGPQHITSPMPSLPEPKPIGMFEQPRTAPQPPQRDTPRHSPRLEVPREFKTHLHAPLHRNNSSHDGVLPIRSASTSPRIPETSSFVVSRPNSIGNVRDNKVTGGHDAEKPPPPLLRRKTSKFIEHIENKEKVSAGSTGAKTEDVPPVPPMVMRASELILPIQGTEDLPPFSAEVQPQETLTIQNSPRSPTVRFAPIYPETEAGVFQPSTPGKTIASIMKPQVTRLDMVEIQSPTSLKRSSTLKELPPNPTQLLRRSMSTTSRPAPMMADVCMAEVKPVLMGPVVAQGHARMISC